MAPDPEKCAAGRLQDAPHPENVRVEATAGAAGQELTKKADTPAVKPADWEGFLAALNVADVPSDFLDDLARDQGDCDRDPFADWDDAISQEVGRR
jgi:hypothetical protein